MTKFITITKNVRGKGEARVIPVLLALRTNEMSYWDSSTPRGTGIHTVPTAHAYIRYNSDIVGLGTCTCRTKVNHALKSKACSQSGSALSFHYT